MIRDEILKDLRNGKSYADVKKKYRSWSQLYDALRVFSEEMEKRFNDDRENLRKVRAELSTTNDKLQNAESARTKIAGEVAKLRQDSHDLTAKIANMTQKHDELRREVKQLEKKGYSPAVLKKLKLAEARSGPELLSRVQTVEKHDRLEKERVCLKKRNDDLEREIRGLEAQKNSIEQLTISERNALDELKRKTASFKESVDTVDSVLREGYHPKDLKSMALGLKAFGIKGDPERSVTRLVEGLQEMKSIFSIEEKLKRKTEELAEVNKSRAIAKSELATTRQATLETIQESQKASQQAIASTRDSSTQAIAETAKQGEKGVERAMEKLEARADEAVGKFEAQIQQAADTYKTELKQIVEIERRRAEVETVLGQGLPLVQMLKSPEDLKKVPLPYILQLMEKIQSWFEMNLPGASIKPPEYIWSKESNLHTMCSYNLAVLVELAKEGLKRALAIYAARETRTPQVDHA